MNEIEVKNQPINSESLLGKLNEDQIWTQPALKPLKRLLLYTKSMTMKFAKKLPSLCIHNKAIPKSKPTLPEGLLPDQPDPRNRHNITSR